MERVKVIVDRSKWLRGEGTVNSMLLRPSDGKMCCLGFVCLALGRTEEDIRELKSPADRHGSDFDRAGHGTVLLAAASYNGTTAEMPDAVGRAMEVNDSKWIHEDEREVTIINALSQLGIDIEFVDGVEVPDAGPTG